MKVAAYQAPLQTISLKTAVELIREQVEWCETEGVEILCCPEGMLGGLADYVSNPADIAVNVEAGELEDLLKPLAGSKVATILGFTEIDSHNRLYNSAAIFNEGAIAGLYRKLYPAINKSIYEPGKKIPVFTIKNLTFGIIICNDSNYCEPARIMASQGAAALFVPTNNGLPPAKANPQLIDQTMNCDIARAVENSVYVIRADVAGCDESLISYGSSEIVDPNGTLLQSAKHFTPDLILADIDPPAPKFRRGWDASKTDR